MSEEWGLFGNLRETGAILNLFRDAGEIFDQPDDKITVMVLIFCLGDLFSEREPVLSIGELPISLSTEYVRALNLAPILVFKLDQGLLPLFFEVDREGLSHYSGETLSHALDMKGLGFVHEIFDFPPTHYLSFIIPVMLDLYLDVRFMPFDSTIAKDSNKKELTVGAVGLDCLNDIHPRYGDKLGQIIKKSFVLRNQFSLFHLNFPENPFISHPIIQNFHPFQPEGAKIYNDFFIPDDFMSPNC